MKPTFIVRRLMHNIALVSRFGRFGHQIIPGEDDEFWWSQDRNGRAESRLLMDEEDNVSFL
jgi:hypothetical protein